MSEWFQSHRAAFFPGPAGGGRATDVPPKARERKQPRTTPGTKSSGSMPAEQKNPTTLRSHSKRHHYWQLLRRRDTCQAGDCCKTLVVAFRHPATRGRVLVACIGTAPSEVPKNLVPYSRCGD